MNRNDRKEYIIMLGLLTALGLVLVVTTIKGPFIIDEDNYLVTVIGLRDGTLSVPGTEGLTPSKELFYFDPEAYGRIASRTPVFSIEPPLYAPIALPFVFFGWRGLVLLNTISYLLIAFIVFVMAKQYATERQTPWLAAVLVLFGGYAIEYAQGLWPHMLSVFLVTSAIYVASRMWNGGRPQIAIICGLLMGIATGIREQNIILTGLLSITLLLFSGKKLISFFWFALGTSFSLAIIGTINFFRQGIFHPFPKAVAFSGQLTKSVSGSSTSSPLQMFWARVVDFSSYPPITDSIQSLFYRKDPVSGVVFVFGVVKKALIQSSPWVALALVILILVWLNKNLYSKDVKTNLKALSLLILPFLAFMTLVGGVRTDGLCYNQRYFLEIIPLAAIALAFALDGLILPVLPMVAGLMGSGILFALTLILLSRPLYGMAISRVPLLLAAVLVVVWIFQVKKVIRLIFPFLVGLCIGWAMFVHIFDDLQASRTRRSRHAAQLAVLESTIPNHSALFANWGSKDAAGPLQLTRDVVILDIWADEGADAVRLTHELELQNRRIFVLTDYFPDLVLKGIVDKDSLAVVSRHTIGISEVVKRNQENHHMEVSSPKL